MQTYALKAGDTLWSVARKFGVPVHLLLEVNPVTDPAKLKAGFEVKIPSVTTDTSEHTPAVPAAAAPARAAAPLAVNRTRYRLPPSQYVSEESAKDMVMLHFTAGSTARGAYDSWINTEARVATAYILDLDGTVYELFDPRYWAYHLGIKGAASANFRHDKRSIGIEIVNVGPLRERQGNLCWWPGDFTQKWCAATETGRYMRAPYRGFEAYAAFTDAQWASLPSLVGHLLQTFNIPARLPAANQRTASDPAGYFRTFTGVASHQNYRADKYDIGPAFDWGRLGV